MAGGRRRQRYLGSLCHDVGHEAAEEYDAGLAFAATVRNASPKACVASLATQSPRARHDRIELFAVRSGPVHTSATRASRKFPVVVQYPWRNGAGDLGGSGRPYGAVALQAARVRLDRAAQIEGAHDFVELLARIRRPEPISVGNAAMPENPPVPRQDDALLAHRSVDDGLVGEVVFPGRVEAQQPQVAHQCAEMNVGDEPGHA